MIRPCQPTVNLYCDFDGVLSPLPSRTPNQLQHQQDCDIPPKPAADCYTLDHQHPYLLGIQWSSELIAVMRNLIRNRLVSWHWLTSNAAWTDKLDAIFGFDSNLTTTEELFTCYNAHVTLTPGGKAGVIRRAIYSTARSPQRRAIAWLDDDYWANQPEVKQIDQLAKGLDIPVLLITPDPTVGITRSQVHSLTEFIQMEDKPIGLTAIS